MAGTSGPLGTSGSDMAGGPSGNWGAWLVPGVQGRGGGGAGAGVGVWGGRGRFFLLLSLP